MTVGVAVIGCGLIGARRAAALPSGMHLVAVCDTDRARAEQLAAGSETGVRVAATPTEAIEGEDVGLVIVATVHRDLAPLAATAADAGRHVLIEKPGACRPGELLPLRSSGAVVRVGYNHRFHPAIMRARDLLEAGDYGQLMWIRGRYGHGGRIGYEREWRADPSISGGGELLDQGVHLIDLVRYLEGPADLAFAELPSAFWAMPVEDNAFLCLRVRTGGLAWLHASWTEWRNLFSLEIAHERAKIEVRGLGGSYGVERLTLHEMSPEMGPPETTAWEWPRGDDSWRAEMSDILAAIDGRPSFGATVDDAIANLEIVSQAYAQ